MALDRWIALVILLIFAAYGYGAWFTMDGSLPPFMRRNPIWPSTFPKVISILGILTALIVVSGIEQKRPKSGAQAASASVYRTIAGYHLAPAIALLALMVVYAFALRPAGFLLSTVGFLMAGAAILGERRWITMFVVSAIAAGTVWYLIQQVLGIFLRPLPAFMGV